MPNAAHQVPSMANKRRMTLWWLSPSAQRVLEPSRQPTTNLLRVGTRIDVRRTQGIGRTGVHQIGMPWSLNPT
jgi:hypothetical protein